MTRYLSWSELLQLAGQLPGDPEFEDLGVLDAALSRVRSRHMNQDVYGSHWLKAAAMLQTLALHAPLERHNDTYAWLVAETFLRVNGHPLSVKAGDALALAGRAARRDAGVRQIATELRAWAT